MSIENGRNSTLNPIEGQQSGGLPLIHPLLSSATDVGVVTVSVETMETNEIPPLMD